MPKMKLSCCDRSVRVWFVKKTSQDNDVTDHIGAVYAENKTELLWSIESGDDYGENKIRQLRD